MEQISDTVVVTKEGYRAIGLKWEGTFAEAGAGEIRRVHEKLRKRLDEIPRPASLSYFYGLSYHANPDSAGFVHYAVVETKDDTGFVPEGMVAIEVPTLSYAKCEHVKGRNIDKSYRNVYEWIERQGHALFRGDLTHCEIYSLSRDPYDPDPEFTIMIPID
ncbi:GyrI-like domain-containing protein [Cohnella hongkongensis]|uniref:GyrI-like domain-containing protein n=1 Tax=Cohnella hongkongensis TaxID=178337 RepID=A0ABV9F8I0_9BACL